MNPSKTFSAASHIKQHTIGNYELLRCHIHQEVKLRISLRGSWTILLTWTAIPNDVPTAIYSLDQ